MSHSSLALGHGLNTVGGCSSDVKAKFEACRTFDESMSEINQKRPAEQLSVGLSNVQIYLAKSTGELAVDLLAPTACTDNLQVIVIVEIADFVDQRLGMRFPATHSGLHHRAIGP